MRLFSSAAMLAVVLSLLLVPSTALSQPVDAGLDIDLGIQGDARAVIARTIRNLPAEYHRGWDILYVTYDQRVFSNRVVLRDTFRFLTPVGDRIYQDRRGEIIVRTRVLRTHLRRNDRPVPASPHYSREGICESTAAISSRPYLDLDSATF